MRLSKIPIVLALHITALLELGEPIRHSHTVDVGWS